MIITRARTSQCGFTLTEIMISLSILGLVSAISFPMFTRVKIGANEAAARKALATYRDGFINFQMDSGTLGYPGAFNELTGYVDDRLASDFATQTGYRFALVASDAATYEIRATPITQGVTGVNTFVITESGAVVEIPGLGLGGSGGTGAMPATLGYGVYESSAFFNVLLTNTTLTDKQKHEILAGLLEQHAYEVELSYLNNVAGGLDTAVNDIRAAYYSVGENQLGALNELFKGANEYLVNDIGIKAYIADRDQVDSRSLIDGWGIRGPILREDTASMQGYDTYGTNDTVNDGFKLVEIGFEFQAQKPQTGTYQNSAGEPREYSYFDNRYSSAAYQSYASYLQEEKNKWLCATRGRNCS